MNKLRTSVNRQLLLSCTSLRVLKVRPLLALSSLLIAAVSFVAPSAFAAHSITALWQTEGLATPESVLFVKDKKSPYLLVSQIDGEPNTADQKGGIAKLSPNGEILALDWVTGLNAPKGMGTDGTRLYVADIDQLVVIDLKKAKVIKKIPVAGAKFLNDVTVTSSGVVFVSDTQTHKVHRIKGEQVSDYLEQVDTANGLLATGSSLVVGAGKSLLRYSPDKKPLVLAQGFAENLDGVEMVKRDEFVVSCWPGLVYYVAADGSMELLMDSREEKINTADIGFDNQRQQLFVPNFFKNTVSAYQLK